MKKIISPRLILTVLLLLFFAQQPSPCRASEYLDIPFHALGAPDSVLNEYFFYFTYLMLEPSLEGGSPFARVVMISTPNEEWMLSIAKPEEESESATVEYMESTPTVWEQMTSRQLDLNDDNLFIAQHVIPKTLAVKLGQIWTTLLTHTKLPKITEGNYGNDGYFFTKYDPQYGPMTGVTWTPNAETVPGQAVEIITLLKDYILLSQPEEEEKPQTNFQAGPRNSSKQNDDASQPPAQKEPVESDPVTSAPAEETDEAVDLDELLKDITQMADALLEKISTNY